MSRAAAEPWLARLLALPAFLVRDVPATPGDLAAAFALTGHFLEMHVWQARGIAPPAVRDGLVGLLTHEEAREPRSRVPPASAGEGDRPPGSTRG